MNRQEITRNLQELGESVKNFIFRGETISTALVAVFLIAALSSIFISPQLYQRNVHEGDIALKNVYAPYDFTYSWGVDEEETARAMETQAKEAPYVLEYNTESQDEIKADINKFFGMIIAERALEVPLNDKINNVKNAMDNKVSTGDIKLFSGCPSP